MAWELMNEPKQEWLSLSLPCLGCFYEQTGASAAGAAHWGQGPATRRPSDPPAGRPTAAACSPRPASPCRCPGCFNNSDADALLEWTAEMSAFLKCIDPNHLVSGEGGIAF